MNNIKFYALGLFLALATIAYYGWMAVLLVGLFTWRLDLVLLAITIKLGERVAATLRPIIKNYLAKQEKLQQPR